MFLVSSNLESGGRGQLVLEAPEIAWAMRVAIATSRGSLSLSLTAKSDDRSKKLKYDGKIQGMCKSIYLLS